MNIDSPQVKGPFVLPGMQRHQSNTVSAVMSTKRMHLRIFDALPNPLRGHVIAMIGEFVGTFLFLFFAFSGTSVANTTSVNAKTGDGTGTSRLLYIALSFGFSLAVNAWVFFRITGGLFNPAVTFSMCLVGALTWFRGLLVFIGQIVGAIAASGVVYGLFPGELKVQTSLGGGTTVVQGLFIEMFLTIQLVFTIFMLAAEKHRATFIAPIGIGLSLFIAELTGVYFTGGSLNPARSIGPAIVTRQFNTYDWIYWVGPLLGGLLASGFYKFMKGLEYETVNPGQDSDVEAARNHSATDGPLVGTGPSPENDANGTNVAATDGEQSTSRQNHSHNSSMAGPAHSAQSELLTH